MQDRSSAITTSISSEGRKILNLIEQKQFEIAFQPIIDLRHQEVVGFEALTRVHADLGYAHAGELFEIAERAGVLWELEEATRAEAIRLSADLPEHVQIFINCSPQVIEDPRFTTSILDILHATGERCAAQVVVEITERSPHLNMATLGDRVDELRQLGLQIAIDDVGMGTNGLVRISALRPGWLKLDRALISHIDQDRFRWNLVRYLVQFARACGVQVIAEGIERPEEVQAVQDMGICFGQGYLLGRPTHAPLDLLAQTTPVVHPVQPTHDASLSSLAMLRGVRTVIAVDRSVAAAEVAQTLLRETDSPGVCVVQDDHLIGWADREEILRAARHTDQSAMPVGLLARHCPTVDAVTVEFAEMFDICATQAQLRDRCPIVLIESSRPVAIVTAQTLLCMAADLFRNASRWTCAAGGAQALPSRVACEEHLEGVLNQAHGTTGRLCMPLDAAVIDIRGLSRFNRVYGFEQGDHLMADLIQLIRSTIVLEVPGIFFGHLGLDAYLLTAPSGTLQQHLRSLLERFDTHVVPRYENGEKHVCLRVVEIADFANRFTEATQVLHAAAEQGQLASTGTRGSIMIPDSQSRDTRGSERRSA